MGDAKELQKALVVLTSLRDKCLNSQEKLAHRPAQYTLLHHRIEALDIALELIQQQLSEHS